MNDPYRTLQVAPNADLETIRAAYRRLARQYHPDLNPRPEAAEQMRAINAAYRLLSDPRQRASHDARLYMPRTVSARTGVVERTYVAPPRRVVAVESSPPTTLQKRVDRVVAVLGVLLLIAIAFYSVSVLPSIQQEQDSERQVTLGQGTGVRPRTSQQAPAAATAQTAAKTTPADHLAGPEVPTRLSSDSGLRSFPGTVLVAPTSLPPFSSLPIARIDATGQGIARYAVYYGDLNNGGATISGLTGRAAFDAAAPKIPDCAPDATYCLGMVVGQPASSPPGLELFRAPDLVEDYPAFATHRVCCNGVYWSLSWYEPRSNMSYTIDLSRNVATRFGGTTAEGDQAALRAVAALADELVRLP